MKLYNQTTLNDKSLFDMLKYVKVNTTRINKLWIKEVDSMNNDLMGQCRVTKNGNFVVYITNTDDELLETLVHELEHVRQYLEYNSLNIEHLERKARRKEMIFNKRG